MTSFGQYVRSALGLVVQPRMGFGDHRAMRAGIAATRAANATTVGTITVDSYTRTGDLATARAAKTLNGYPIATQPRAATTSLHSPDFPVQVRARLVHPGPDRGRPHRRRAARHRGRAGVLLPALRPHLACRSVDNR